MREMLAYGPSQSKVERDLGGFICVRDPDVESFLRDKSVPFEKAHKCRTYLVVRKRPDPEKPLAILGYFSLAISRMMISSSVSRTRVRKLNGIGERREVPCYLLGQLGKNDSYSREIEGNRLISYALNLLKDGHERFGGRFVRVDCRDIGTLCEFYERNGFKFYQRDQQSGLVQMVRFF